MTFSERNKPSASGPRPMFNPGRDFLESLPRERNNIITCRPLLSREKGPESTIISIQLMSRRFLATRMVIFL